MKKSKYDAIISVCGGLERDGTPHPWVIRRLDKAMEFYTGKELFLISGRGTPYRPPPKDRYGFPIDECDASAKYLAGRGIRPERILLERFAMDTIGNGYFKRVLFAEPMKLRRILVVTSEFHMPRVKKIFNWVYALKPQKIKFKVDFLKVSDKGLNPGLMRTKNALEKKNLKRLLPIIKRIRTMKKLREFIFFEHACYTYRGKIEKLSGKIIKTY